MSRIASSTRSQAALHRRWPRILEVRLDPDIQSRIAELAAKANEGEFSNGERAEYELLIDKADLLAFSSPWRDKFLPDKPSDRRGSPPTGAPTGRGAM